MICLTCMNAAPKSVIADQPNEVAKDGEGHGADDGHHQDDDPCRPALRIVVGHSHLGCSHLAGESTFWSHRDRNYAFSMGKRTALGVD